MELPPITRRQRWAFALAATFTMTISYVDRQTLAVLAPRVTAELGIDEIRFGLLLSAFSVAYLIGAPLSGLWIDRVGARRGLLVAVCAWTVVAALHTVAPSFAALLALRVALGFAESPSFPGAAQTVQRALLPEDRARGLGVLFTGSSIGAMIAPPLATAIMAGFGWRMAFLGTAIAGLVWVPIWLAVAWTRRGVALLDPRPADSFPHPGETPDGAAFRSPGRFAGAAPLLRNPALWRALVLIVASAPAISFVILWSSKFLVRTYGLSPVDVGRYLWIPPLCYDLGSVLFGDLSSRRARRNGFDGSPDRGLIAVAACLTACVAFMPRMAPPRAPWPSPPSGWSAARGSTRSSPTTSSPASPRRTSPPAAASARWPSPWPSSSRCPSSAPPSRRKGTTAAPPSTSASGRSPARSPGSSGARPPRTRSPPPSDPATKLHS